jgi:hypothetical protein
MTHPKFGLLLKANEFNLDNQFLFAHLSGDYNPIHTDEIFSRRTLYGQSIVHGVYSVMWAIESLIDKVGVIPSSCNCKFKKPIFLGEGVSCYWNESTCKIVIAIGDIELTSITVDSSKGYKGVVDNGFGNALQVKQFSHPNDLLPENCLRFINDHKFFSTGETILVESLFPNLCRFYGVNATLEFSAMSAIVGMQCPGLHSLFASLKIDFFANHTSAYFNLVNYDPRFNKVDINARGFFLSAYIEAFFRPAPSESESINDLSLLVSPHEFTNVRALVMGGSRGIGAVVAKLICAGGGHCTITYNKGLDDAVKVSSEIKNFGKECNQIHYSIESPSSIINTIPNVNQLYYFTSPKIIGESLRGLNLDLLNYYKKYYVDGFIDICEMLVKYKTTCSVFYPSTTFIEDSSMEFKSYLEAKILGEKICSEFYSDHGINIISVRLPKLPSDQNQNIFPENLEKISDVILPVIRRMCKF